MEINPHDKYYNGKVSSRYKAWETGFMEGRDGGTLPLFSAPSSVRQALRDGFKAGLKERSEEE